MEDGLYFLGQWVAEIDVVINKQVNDLQTPVSLQTTYANSFTLPDTGSIRALLQNAEQVDSGGRDPYRLIPFKVIEEGEVIHSGMASLQTFQGGWKVLLAGPASDLTSQLADLKLSDLDLSRYDHPWTLESVSRFAGKTDGIIYPLIDNGSMDGGVFAQDTICPAPYLSTLIRQMLKQCGYKPKGDWLTDPFIRRIFLPFVNERPTNHDDEWVRDRYARVAVPDNPDPIVLKNGHPIDLLLPFSVDDKPLDGFEDGKLDRYKADRAAYVCIEAMRVKVMSSVTFASLIRYGAPEIRLIVERNGNNVGEAYWSEAGYLDHLDYPDVLTLDTSVDCRAGDELCIRLQGNSKTDISSYGVYFSRTLPEMWASFEPDPAIHQGDTWVIGPNLPDMTCGDLFRSLALMCSATYDIDEVAKTVELKTLNSVFANEINATDLSSCIEESNEPEVSVVLQPYGQRNLLKWRALEEKIYAGYGDGVIGCDAKNIPLETTLFEMPFSAVVPSTNNVPGFGSPPFIETRSVTGSGSNLQVSSKSTAPRLLLAEPSKPINATVNEVTPDLITVKTVIQLTPCWWHARQQPIKLSENNFSLAFDRPAGLTSLEKTIIQQYFGGLRRILLRPRQLTVPAYLKPWQFASLDMYAPVRLRAVRAGSIDLNDGYYYLNKVSNYQPGIPCSLILIAY
ncbi:hypothetical protein [Spirosoma agri]|uniref:Uncharacterized protein n=1 Tax=Spirosoma agri TaxID=1987381 RepID=A0A6M0II92_9BACT|nr:hypothetical protein [Spirosoma agri]NEU67948.1 hypothetical protein [Spirosoma agri]